MSSKNILTIVASPFITAAVAALFFLAITSEKPEVPERPLSTPQIVSESQFGQILSIATTSAQQAVSQPTPGEQAQTKNPFLQGEVKLALLGDSMVDTMGDLKTLELALSQYFPNVKFRLLNYGVGSTPVESGLKRLSEGFRNHDQDFPSLFSQNPDIIIVESFAYNHPLATPEDITQYKNTLNQVINEIRSKNITPLLLVTIGPNSETFAQGAPGINWSPEQKKIATEEIRAFLEVAIDVAKSSGIPLIDAYHPSLDINGNGKQIFINPGDNIHPSQAGIELVSDLITQKLKELSIIEQALSP